MTALRVSRMDVIVCLYSIFLLVLSFTLPITVGVRAEVPANALYVPILLIYLSGVGLVFLTYVCLKIYNFKKPMTVKKRKKSDRSISGKRNSPRTKRESSIAGTLLTKDHPEIVSLVEGSKNDNCPPGSSEKINDKNKKKGESDPPFRFHGRGANFFMRMGIVAFGLGSILLESFRLFSYAESSHVLRCFGVLYTVTAGIHLFTYLFQAYFLFKYHNIILNFETAVMKFGIAHLVVFNMAGWFQTVAVEAGDTILNLLEVRSKSTVNATMANQTITKFQRLGCTRNRVIADEVGGYLFPVVIAYSMLSSALLLKIYTTIGKPFSEHRHTPTPPHGQFLNSHCYKANSGLFAGLTVLLLTISSVCFFLYHNNQTSTEDVPGVIFLFSTLGVNTCALLTLPPAMIYLQRLKFIKGGALRLDDVLLLISLAGHYMLLTIMFLPWTTQIFVSNVRGVSLKALGWVCFLVDFIQSTIQVVFILDGVCRRSSCERHMIEKPGRSLVTFLLICNICTWLVSSLELKESYHRYYYTEFYGPVAWVIMLYISMPLSIFFRFHSSVCLSNIWLYAYEQTPGLKKDRPKLVSSTTQTFTESIIN